MAELVVVGFDNPEEADRVLLKLNKLKREHLIDLEDAVVVVRDEAGKIHLKQSINLVSTGATVRFTIRQPVGQPGRLAIPEPNRRICTGRRLWRRRGRTVRLLIRLWDQR